MKTELCTFRKEVLIYKSHRNYVYKRNPGSIVLYLGYSTNKVSLINIKNVTFSYQRGGENTLEDSFVPSAGASVTCPDVSFSASHSPVLIYGLHRRLVQKGGLNKR